MEETLISFDCEDTELVEEDTLASETEVELDKVEASVNSAESTDVAEEDSDWAPLIRKVEEVNIDSDVESWAVLDNADG